MKKFLVKYSVISGLLLLVLLGVFSTDLLSQDINFKASAPNVVRTGEQFQLVFTLDKNVDDFTPPDFGDFRYLGGPSTGSSTSINMVNGRTTRVSTYSFTYYLQAPGTSGKYSLEAATADYKRKSVQSNKLTIEVVGNSSSQNQSSTQVNNSKAAGTTSPGGNDIFVRLEFDKTSAHVGEQITAWVKLYTQVNIAGIDQQFKGPDFVGFYKQKVEIPPLRNLEREKVGDDIYHTGLLQKFVLYPQKTGEILIDPFELIVEVQKQTRRRQQSIFDEFFGSQYERSRLSLKSQKVKLNIKSLPGSQPNDFSGAVGKFDISGSSNLSLVNTNDAITFKVTVSGRGNVKLIDNVVTGFPSGFDVFDPVKKVSLNESSEGKSGKVTFEYTAIPRHAGNFTVEPFSLVYFDIASKTYRTLKTSQFNIQVVKSDSDSTTVVSSNLSKEEIELLGSDIRHIEQSTNFRNKDDYFLGRTWFLMSYVLILAILIIILIIRKEQIKRSADKVKYRNRKAGKTASRRLKVAHKLLKSNDKNAYFDELERALWGYLSDKLGIPLAELSREMANDVLLSRGLGEEEISNFLKIIDSCQYAKYAPGGMEAEMTELFWEANKVFSKIDQSL